MKYRKEAVHATNPEVLAAGRRKLVFAALAVLAVVLVAGTWLLVHSLQPKQNDAAVKPEMAVSQPKTVEKKQATEPAEHHGNSPDCPDTDCIAMLVNGDLLFHEGLWNQYASTNTAADEAPEYDEDMKLDELKEVAARYGVDASAMRKKADVIAAIEAAKAEQPDDGTDDEEPPQIGAADPV